MTNTQDSTISLLWLAPRSKLADRLAARFALREEGASAIFAAGARASEALRAALASPGAIKSIVLISPPAIAALEPDVGARLREIETPVLALFGTGDVASPPDFGHAWRRGLAKCFVTHVYAAGADMANERPAAVAAIAADFVTRGEGFLVKATDGRLYQ